MTAVREELLDVDGLELRVAVRGTGKPVLLLNGVGGHLAMWQAAYKDLEGFEVIAFDAPGAGHSSIPAAPCTIEKLASLATAVLDRLGYEQVDALGYSYGGAVAQQLAHQAPDRVRRLVLAATACGWGAIPGPLSAYLALATPVRYYSELAYRLTNPLIGGLGRDADETFFDRTSEARVSAPPPIRGYLYQLVAGMGWSSLPWLHTVEHPTLLLYGACDRLLPTANGKLIAAHLPNARLRIFEEWGHGILLDCRSGAGRAVADFYGADELESSVAWREAQTVSHQQFSALRKPIFPGTWQAAIGHAAWRRLFAGPARAASAPRRLAA